MSGTIGILGGGISGIALAAHLRVPCEVLEAEPMPGGLCASLQEAGFTFDVAGPHILFSKNQEVLGRMIESLGGNVHRRRRENRIWFKGHLVKYPFENGLGDLPKEDCYECILGYLRNPWVKVPENLQEWSYANFGSGISDKYFLPYNRKIWNLDPAEISLEWVARIPKPPMEDVLKSAIGIATEGYLHQLYFHYPVLGGFQALVQAFGTRIRAGAVRESCPVLKVAGAAGAWTVTTALGERHYETLVSTLPVHELARIWDGFPAEGREALAGLRYNGLINILLGVAEDRGYPYTALYVPDEDILFHRLSFPKAFSEKCVPSGHSSMMAEITSRPGDGRWELGDAELLARTVASLERMGLLAPSTLAYRKVLRFPYGYPIYDTAYFDRVAALHRSVRATGIHLLGRFAQFEYINSDVCVERALALAGVLNQS